MNYKTLALLGLLATTAMPLFTLNAAEPIGVTLEEVEEATAQTESRDIQQKNILSITHAHQDLVKVYSDPQRQDNF